MVFVLSYAQETPLLGATPAFSSLVLEAAWAPRPPHSWGARCGAAHGCQSSPHGQVGE